MSKTDHPITPPPDLVEDWIELAKPLPQRAPSPGELATQAARWGADQELEACCEVLARELICDGKHVATDLRAIRRPKPPSLKGQALEAAQRFYAKGHEDCTDEEIKDDFEIIRRALELLPND